MPKAPFTPTAFVRSPAPDTDSATFYAFDPALTIVRMPELEAIIGLARPTIYKRLKDDPTFPRPVPLSDSKARGAPVGWVLGEIQAWLRSRIDRRGEVAA